jgi:hypothetical protein
MGQPQKFEVYMLDSDVAPRSAAIVAFEEQTAKLQRAVMGANSLVGETMTRIQALRRAIDAAPGADDKLSADARSLEQKLRDIQVSLSGDNTMSRRSEPVGPSLISRLGGITGGLWGNTLDEPTNTQRHQYDLVAADFAKVLAQLKPLVETDLRRVEDAAEAAGAPWTPGRVPTWKP